MMLFCLVALMPSFSKASSCVRSLQPLHRFPASMFPDVRRLVDSQHHTFNDIFDVLQERTYSISSSPRGVGQVPASTTTLSSDGINQQKHRVESTDTTYSLQISLPGNSATTVNMDVQAANGEREIKITSKWPKNSLAWFSPQTFKLSEDTVLDTMDGTFSNGVLTVTADRVAPPPAKIRRIPVVDREEIAAYTFKSPSVAQERTPSSVAPKRHSAPSHTPLHTSPSVTPLHTSPSAAPVRTSPSIAPKRTPPPAPIHPLEPLLSDVDGTMDLSEPSKAEEQVSFKLEMPSEGDSVGIEIYSDDH